MGIGQSFEELEGGQTCPTGDFIQEMQFIEIAGNVDPTKPLIYLWEILDAHREVCYRYVGKASGGAKRPRKHYRRNVKNLLLGNPYRKNKLDKFRPVHRKLAKAVNDSQKIRLSFICNVSSHENINSVERKWQQHYGLVSPVHFE